ncbi:unnamed protein product [Lactuca virosa]|uniref:Phosphomannose isomerase type I catalytic domain-containing protein n=1 Tax=Lactuca virosa TaxID=75947 RepID=A0AAU9M3Z7_9ASTR|nr:unnamed protein product [Lactuca virosa]
MMEVNGDKHEKHLVKLKCSVQNYDWGRIGYDSRVVRPFERNCGGQIKENKHYVEFWIGIYLRSFNRLGRGNEWKHESKAPAVKLSNRKEGWGDRSPATL